jgi:maleate cis-trans isomerase
MSQYEKISTGSVTPKRLGLIVPSVNTIIEDDLRLFKVPEVSTHIARIQLSNAQPEALERALADAPAEAEKLVDSRVQAIMLACTGASMVGGAGGNSHFIKDVARFTDVPVSTMADALVGALRSLDVKIISLFSPFPSQLNDIEAAFFAQAGFRVAKMFGLGIADPKLCAAIKPEEIVEFAERVDMPESEAVVLSCANLRGFEAADNLEKRLGKPVVTSNQAMLWSLMRAVGVDCRIAGGGRLLRAHGEYQA